MPRSFDGVLFDNDALSLLAASRLLPRALDLYGFDALQAYRLESLPYMLRRGQIGRRWSSDARERAARDGARIRVWNHEPGAALLDRFIGTVGIDPGEAALFASLVERPDIVMMSGDKRALMAFATDPGLRDLCDAVAGRILCLEDVLDALVEADGARAIGAAFAACQGHQTLSVIFTETTMANDALCREHIASYRRHLTATVGEEFLYIRDAQAISLDDG